jgi:hypothetical protein
MIIATSNQFSSRGGTLLETKIERYNFCRERTAHNKYTNEAL